MANTEANLPENVLLSHGWAQAFTKLLQKPCAPQKSNEVMAATTFAPHCAGCEACPHFVLSITHYLAGEISALFIHENIGSYKTF